MLDWILLKGVRLKLGYESFVVYIECIYFILFCFRFYFDKNFIKIYKK